ncbi:hypothetical protein OG21DRAFT_1511031 [Imleria badia]|nr:hypothetical protein OG21DRAFT_1511031 [Imleria badia]
MSSNSTASTSKASLSAEALYIGIDLQGILYGTRIVIAPLPGIKLYLYFKTMRIFLARRRARRKSDVFYAS